MKTLRIAATLLALPLLSAALLARPAPAPQDPQPQTSPRRVLEKDDEKGNAANDAEVKRRWEELDPKERETLKNAYERWQKLTPDERENLKRRHQRLEQIRERTHETLTDEERDRLRSLREGDRRGEIDRIVRDHLKSRLDKLPPDVRRRMTDEWKNVPPDEREKDVHRILQEEIDRRIVSRLHGMVERGELKPADVESFRNQVKDAPRSERAELLRRFVVDHADSFNVPPEMRNHLRDAKDPARALFELERRRRGQEARPMGPLERARQRREKERQQQQKQEH